MLNNNFHKIFPKLPIIGMIHLAGEFPVKRALEEIAIFEEEQIDAALIENYHGSVHEVINTLEETSRINPKLVIGVNILPNEWKLAFALTHHFGGKFIQLDYISGKYTSEGLDEPSYQKWKEKYPEVVVLGGVWPKYYEPVAGSDLKSDLQQGMQRAEANVVTGEGTEKETPLDKIRKFREALGTHPLIIGAGLNPDNAYRQLVHADGAIVGSAFKPGGYTENPIDRVKVKDFMDAVKEVRKYKERLAQSKA